MMTSSSTVSFEATPESVAELRRLREERRRRLPRRFARRWRCTRHECDGEPHEKRPYKHARSSQIIPDDARVGYLVGGRGSGKTWASSHNFAQTVLETDPDPGDDHTEWAVIGPIFATARDVMIEGPSGLIRAFGGYERDGGLVSKWDRTYGHLRLITGALIYADSADDGAIRIQGKNLYGALCGEIGLWRKWQRAWEESIAFAVRKGPAKLICDGTPKRSSLAKYLLDDSTVWRRRLRTFDNLANLAQAAVQELLDKYSGTRLGQQELEGLLVDDAEFALWRRANIDGDRVVEHVVVGGAQDGKVYWQRADGTQLRPPPFWLKVIVALDPADGEEDGDEQGIAVVAQSADDHELYVLHSDGLKLNAHDFLVAAVSVALEYKNARIPSPVEIVIEKNHGGGFLLGLLDQVMKELDVSVQVRAVDANRSTGGKRTRAEDVSGMYERHMVHHVGVFADLEDQQCNWTGMGREPSPDRMDALVWALKQFVTGHLGEDELVNADDLVVQWADATGIAQSVFQPSPPPARSKGEVRDIPSVRW